MSIHINDKDTKSRRVTMEHRNIDVGIENKGLPSSMSDLLQVNRNEESIKRFDFEVSKYGTTENILADYIAYLTDPTFINRVYMTEVQSNHLKFNINALSLVLYGDINMAWTISFLNDLVKHPSDLTPNLLTDDGILAFNTKGVEALRELLKFKKLNEQNEGNGDREAMFTLDSF